MTMLHTRRRDKKGGVKAAPEIGASGARRSVESELAGIAGLERVTGRDPIHHLIEHSRELFDIIGKKNAEKMYDTVRGQDSGPVGEGFGGSILKGLGDSLLNGIFGKPEENGVTEKAPQNSGADKQGESSPEARAQDGFYRRFSETAFSKGRLLCAVEQGGGKTMMTSCIKRSIDQSPPTDSRQSEAPRPGAANMRVPDSRAGLRYHRYTRGALELVVDTAQNLTRTLQVFQRLACGELDDRLGLPEIDTAYRMYPFLNTRREKESLERYKEELKSLPAGSERKAALEFGVKRLNSMISHKERMRNDFYFQLGKILDNSKRAEELFSMPETEEEIVRELMGTADEGEEN